MPPLPTDSIHARACKLKCEKILTRPSTLVDIRNIHIDSSLPAAKKMQSYFEQIVNPYCFLCGDTPVRIRFVAEDRTLKQSLCDYFLSLK